MGRRWLSRAGMYFIKNIWIKGKQICPRQDLIRYIFRKQTILLILRRGDLEQKRIRLLIRLIMLIILRMRQRLDLAMFIRVNVLNKYLEVGIHLRNFLKRLLQTSMKK